MTCLLAAPVELERLLLESPPLWKMVQARLDVLLRRARADDGDARVAHQLVLRLLIDHCARHCARHCAEPSAGERRSHVHLGAITEMLAQKWLGSECAGMSEVQPLEALAGDAWLDELHRRHRIAGHPARGPGVRAFAAMAERCVIVDAREDARSDRRSGEPPRVVSAQWYELALGNLARLARSRAGYAWLGVGVRLAVRREIDGPGERVPLGRVVAGDLHDPAAYQVAMGCWIAWNAVASAYDSLTPKLAPKLASNLASGIASNSASGRALAAVRAGEV